jgi:hypothetical protein
MFYAPYVRRPFDYYVMRAGHPITAPVVLYPSEAYASFDFALPPGNSLAEALDRARQSAPRTWIVLSHAAPDTACRRAIDDALRSTFPVVEDHQFRDVDVRLYSRIPDAGATATDSSRLTSPPGEKVVRQCPQR